MQIPIDPLTSQASHWPVQALSQQTPSTQLPLAHSPAPEQLCPLGLPTQVWTLQTGRLAGQSAALQQWPALPLPPPVQMSTQTRLFGSHLVLAPQASPQRPQLALVPRVVSHPGWVLQSPKPAWHCPCVHCPLVQAAAAFGKLHGLLHPPQLARSFVVSTHAFPHFMGAEAPQSETQVCWPLTVEQSGFVTSQAIPHLPQLVVEFSSVSQSGLPSQFP